MSTALRMATPAVAAVTGFFSRKSANARSLLAEQSIAAPKTDPHAARSLDDPHLHLFVDDREIAHTEGLLRVVNRPRKYPQPVVVADQPWEGDRAQAWGSVIQEPDGLLRMWYFSMNTEHFGIHGAERAQIRDRGGYAYAESRDGIHWAKPPLGIVEFRGSRENNLFYTCAPDDKNLVELDLARAGLGLPALEVDGTQIGVVNNLDGAPAILRNDRGNRQNFLVVQLEGRPVNRGAVGAVVTVTSGDLVQRAERRSGDSYLSHSDARLHFGLGTRSRIDIVEVRWPDGTVQRARDIPANTFMKIVQQVAGQ